MLYLFNINHLKRIIACYTKVNYGRISRPYAQLSMMMVQIWQQQSGLFLFKELIADTFNGAEMDIIGPHQKAKFEI